MRIGHLAILLAVVIPCATTAAHAQWLTYPVPGTPRLKDGKPNLTAPAPRAHGKPDLSGIWEPEGSPRKILANLFPPGVGLLPGGVNGLGEDDPQKYFLNILADFKPGESPLTPAAAELLRKKLGSTADPTTLCQPPAVPTSDMVPSPFKIIQNAGLTLILYEAEMVFRQIYTDGRKHPVDPQPSFMGYSIGRWEGDWFVVDVMGFNDRSPLDAMGHFHSDAMKVTERFHRRDFGHMDVRITLDDAKTFTRPVTIEFTDLLLPDTDVFESFCAEGERDLAHLSAK
jgi:hypothetical protein